MPIVTATLSPVMDYALDIMGRGNAALLGERRLVAHAASPEAGGKNPDLIHAFRDGKSGRMDPAFINHILPVKHISLAVWEKWVPRQTIMETLRRLAQTLWC